MTAALAPSIRSPRLHVGSCWCSRTTVAARRRSGHDRTRMPVMPSRVYAPLHSTTTRAKLPVKHQLRPIPEPGRIDAMSASTPRFCQCGQQLARDHAGNVCNSCELQAAADRSGPPIVSAGFWETPAFGDAFAAQHMGHVSRAFRRHTDHAAHYGRDGISQERLGSWLGLTQAQVSRIENGPPIRNLDTLAYWARTLRIPAHLLWFKLPPETRGQGGQAQRAEPPVPPVAVSFHATPKAVGRLHDPDAVAMRAFRAADLQSGGGHM